MPQHLEMPSHELQFILSTPSAPGQKDPQKKVARSHAARSAHAKARRLRTLEHQAQKNRQDPSLFSAWTGCGLITPLSASRRDSFASFALPLKPIEERLFDHYVTVVVPLMRCNAFDEHFTERMMHGWVPLAVAEQSLLYIIFLASCRTLANQYTDRPEQKLFNRLAFQYKLVILRSLRESITTEAPRFSDTTVSKALMLAYDEMLKQHVQGAVQMVNLNGGPQTLGLDGLMARLLSNLLNKVIIELGVPVRVPWNITPVQ
ncbi:hypothetical protein ASPCAL03255 [Aspergillus calidoustus]|uniref:Uncharacterized protein n=1 Tax=Aspergillus calidoustus TaxID=454130 RepID=A0A0U5GSR2_ASPCI|nr:hypothetical protein ASPCAL03255 [Aspergillus calidoustus]